MIKHNFLCICSTSSYFECIIIIVVNIFCEDFFFLSRFLPSINPCILSSFCSDILICTQSRICTGNFQFYIHCVLQSKHRIPRMWLIWNWSVLIIILFCFSVKWIYRRWIKQLRLRILTYFVCARGWKVLVQSKSS
jgi:hypothetical protein